jgi:hypothetical protein
MPEQAPVQAPEWNAESVDQQTKALETSPDTSAPEQQTAPEGEQTPEVQSQKPKDTPEVELARMKGALAETRARMRNEAAQRKELERQLTVFQQQVQRQQQPQVQITPFEEDPGRHIAQKLDITLAQQQQLARAEWERQQQAYQHQQQQAFVNHVNELGSEFVQAQPDALDGINFLKSQRVEQYKAGGLSAQEAVQRMLRDEFELVQWALQNEQNPHEVAFNMAKKAGYVSPAEKLRMQQQGQGAALPQSTGGKSGGKVSLEALAKMSSEEFAKATSGDNWAKLMKGQ